ncbi:MAG: glycosyltransferase family 4 protein [Dehalococcoidia bacterium]|nr:glycosyltransferase family 4 protein [Dehalococcoidia bacterium]
MPVRRLAFVPPWYGVTVLGGAEQVCRTTAERLAAAGTPVEVLTTCAKDLFTGWGRNYHKPGLTIENGVPVHRFALSGDPLVAFGDLNTRLINRETLTAQEEERYWRESVNSADLYRRIAEWRADTLFLFIPYPFGTTFFGAQVAPESSWLIPCLHDEGYAHMRGWRAVYQQIAGVICLSRPERALVRQLYDVDPAKIHLWGAGVDTDRVGNAERFRTRFGVEGPFVVCVGRRDPTKNTPELIEYFCRYHLHHPSDLKLVLIGSGVARVPPRFRDRVLDLGTVTEQEKLDACAAAFALCNPSYNESFSFVLMEAWLQETPVLVNAQCAVTTDHARAASGGLAYGSFAEFAECLEYLRAHEAVRRRMGRNGRQYVLANYTWGRLVERFQRLLG